MNANGVISVSGFVFLLPTGKELGQSTILIEVIVVKYVLYLIANVLWSFWIVSHDSFDILSSYLLLRLDW